MRSVWCCFLAVAREYLSRIFAPFSSLFVFFLCLLLFISISFHTMEATYPDLEQIFPWGSKVSTSFCLRLSPTFPQCFTYSFRACLKLVCSFHRYHIKEKEIGEWWKEHWGQWNGGIGEVVKWDSLVGPYAGRNRGRLHALISGTSFYHQKGIKTQTLWKKYLTS